MTVILFCYLVFNAPTPAVGETVTGQEYAVKVGFIYNFAGFTNWPKKAFDNDPDSVTLCVASDNPSSEALNRLNGKKLKKRKIKVINYKQESCLTQGHILFFATQEKAVIQKILDQSTGRQILTIGEIDDFTRIGGIINLFAKGSRMGFSINIDEAERNGLKFSSQLLRSADEIVRGLFIKGAFVKGRYKNGVFVKEEHE